PSPIGVLVTKSLPRQLRKAAVPTLTCPESTERRRNPMLLHSRERGPVFRPPSRIATSHKSFGRLGNGFFAQLAYNRGVSDQSTTRCVLSRERHEPFYSDGFLSASYTSQPNKEETCSIYANSATTSR